MQLVFELTLDYGEDGISDDDPSPDRETIADWITQGMAAQGYVSADVRVEQA